MASLSIRIDFGPDVRIGPGKIALLERVGELGSIAAAGKSMGMSYRRAWELIAELNATFDRPLVDAKVGGRQGGGTILTAYGQELVGHYRAIEAKATEAAEQLLQALDGSRAVKVPASDAAGA